MPSVVHSRMLVVGTGTSSRSTVWCVTSACAVDLHVARSCMLGVLVMLMVGTGVVGTAPDTHSHPHQHHILSEEYHSCNFPTDWCGRWYQNGLGEVQITTRGFHPKGTCMERNRDYYLVKHQARDSTCYRCLLIMQRHNNILQYKESYCLNQYNLRYICDQIRVEATLYTLVKVHHRVIPCPWPSSMLLTYNNNTRGSCSHDMSTVTACATRAQQLFTFHKCTHRPYTTNTARDLECIGKWKAGSDFYLYGSFVNHEHRDGLQTYRCFKYAIRGRVVELSMSADASCQGLNSPSDGPLVMRLTQVPAPTQQPSCQLPSWLSGTSWHSLSGVLSYRLSDDGTTLIGLHRQQPYMTHKHQTHRCMQSEAASSTQLILKAYTKIGCDSWYECMKIERPVNHMLHIVHGRRLADSNDLCSIASYYDTHYTQTVTATYHDMTDCPLQGSYTTTDLQATVQAEDSTADDCSRPAVDLAAGCHNRSLMMITTSCHNHSTQKELMCEHQWIQGGDRYFIARETTGLHRKAVCLRYTESTREGSNITRLIAEPHCNHGVHTGGLLPINHTITMQKLDASCWYATSTEATRHTDLTTTAPPPTTQQPNLFYTIFTNPKKGRYTNYSAANNGSASAGVDTELYYYEQSIESESTDASMVTVSTSAPDNKLHNGVSSLASPGYTQSVSRRIHGEVCGVVLCLLAVCACRLHCNALAVR